MGPVVARRITRKCMAIFKHCPDMTGGILRLNVREKAYEASTFRDFLRSARS